jgi:hypothetical protein
MSSLSLIRALSGGLLAGLDLSMTVQPKVGTDPDGKSVTIQVVGVVFRGSVQQLQEKTLEIARSNADFRVRLAHVETEVMKMIGVDSELVDQAADIVDEFHPEDPPVSDLKPPASLQPPTVEAAPAAQVAGTLPSEPVKKGRGRPHKSEPAAPAPAPAPAPEPEPLPEPEDEPLIKPPQSAEPLFT